MVAFGNCMTLPSTWKTAAPTRNSTQGMSTGQNWSALNWKPCR